MSLSLTKNKIFSSLYDLEMTVSTIAVALSKSEAVREKTNNELVPTRSDTNRAVQSQKMVRDCKFGFRRKSNCTIRVAKTKALISSYCEADLRLCFRLCRLWVFPCGSNSILNGQSVKVVICIENKTPETFGPIYVTMH